MTSHFDCPLRSKNWKHTSFIRTDPCKWLPLGLFVSNIGFYVNIHNKCISFQIFQWPSIQVGYCLCHDFSKCTRACPFCSRPVSMFPLNQRGTSAPNFYFVVDLFRVNLSDPPRNSIIAQPCGSPVLQVSLGGRCLCPVALVWVELQSPPAVVSLISPVAIHTPVAVCFHRYVLRPITTNASTRSVKK